MRKNLIDPFFTCQPQQTFEQDLADYHPNRIHFTDQTDADTIALRSVYLDAGPFAEDTYLQTELDSFREFLSCNGIGGDGYPVVLRQKDGFATEEFEFHVSVRECVLYASEREGARRGLIYLEDCLCIQNGHLKLGVERKKPVLVRRISRGFCSPIKRAPKFRDELADDIDYYSEGYLNRLMHNGVNVLWIVGDFASLIKSSYITEFGEGREKPIAKLQSVCEKCARYGIQVFLFAIEPIAFYMLEDKHPGIHKRYPQVLGNNNSGTHAFCTYTEFGENYLAEAVENLFRSVPKLAGLMSITYGERVSSCANTFSNADGSWHNNCPHCRDKSRMEIVAHTVDIITRSMKKVNPKAEFISWTYHMRYEPESSIYEYVEKVPEDAIMMQNFEDGGRTLQLGKKRFALDYYLNYTGPCRMYSETAKSAQKHNKRLYAKMQVCCSHELATMPYIPVPGIIYDKITRAKDLGTTGIMESWFFGSYPCLMSKAVDLLAYADSYGSKREFLEKLAGLTYSREDVQHVVDAFDYFEKGYKNYPVNVMFNYYGPMHDGVVWELALHPKNYSLSRTWLLQDKPDGDRIGECLFEGHTMEEAITLCEILRENWEAGCRCLEKTSVWNGGDEMVEVAKALRILFKSGCNILNYYHMRDKLGYEQGDGKALLAAMRTLVEAEIENSRAMIPLCQANNCFGYHSEAEGHKFFPAKLESRIKSLEQLLETEFSDVAERLDQGKPPLPYYLGQEDDAFYYYAADKESLENAQWQAMDKDNSKFRIAQCGDEIQMELCSKDETDFLVCNEFALLYPTPTYIFKPDGTVALHAEAYSHQSVLDEKVREFKEKWTCQPIQSEYKTHLVIRGKKDAVGFVRFPYKCLIRTQAGENWCLDTNPVRVLGKSTTSPGDFGWVL